MRVDPVPHALSACVNFRRFLLVAVGMRHYREVHAVETRTSASIAKLLFAGVKTLKDGSCGEERGGRECAEMFGEKIAKI